MENAFSKNSRRRCALHQRETVGESNQISPFCASAIPLTVDCAAAHIGGSASGYLPTHSTNWPLGRPLVMAQRKQADRIFMQWRPPGERPHLPR